MSNIIKVSAVQAPPAFLDIDLLGQICVALIEEAANGSAKPIAFPEAFVPRYPWWIWHGTPDWPGQRGFTQKYFENAALSYDDPRCEIPTLGCVAVSNYPGSCPHRTQRLLPLYIAQWITGESGETLLRRRKQPPIIRKRFRGFKGFELSAESLNF